MNEFEVQRDLDFMLEVLEELEYVIQASGAIAESGMVIEVVPHSKSGKRYARKRTTVDGKKNFEGCGQVGSEKHLKALETLQSLNLHEQITDLLNQVEALKKSEDWQAITSPLRVEVQEVQNINRIEPEPSSLPEQPESQFISFAFKGGKGATPENRVVHAIPGEAPVYLYWDTPALCGAQPSPSLRSWGWIGDCTIFYLSCKKCEKKLKTIPNHIRLPDGLFRGI